MDDKYIKLIPNKRQCINECFNDEKYIYELKNICYEECPYPYIAKNSDTHCICDEDKMFEIAVTAGANDVYKEDDVYVIETNIENMLNIVAELTKELKQEPQSAEWFWKANEYIDNITDKDFLQKYQKLIDALDDLDDITEVYTNADIEIQE